MISYVVPFLCGTLPTQRTLFKTKQKSFIATCYLPNCFQTLHPNIQWPSLYGLWTSLTPFQTPSESAERCVPHCSWDIAGIPPHEWFRLCLFLHQNALHPCPHSIIVYKNLVYLQGQHQEPSFVRDIFVIFIRLVIIILFESSQHWVVSLLSSTLILPVHVPLLFCSICL